MASELAGRLLKVRSYELRKELSILNPLVVAVSTSSSFLGFLGRFRQMQTYVYFFKFPIIYISYPVSKLE